MKLKKLSPFRGKTPEDVIKYLTIELAEVFKQLEVLSDNLDFLSNFRELFISDELTITAGQELRVRNNKNKKLKYMIPLYINDSDVYLTKGSTEWTNSWIYVKNQGTETAITKIMFFN